jgi:hypothetical protein
VSELAPSEEIELLAETLRKSGRLEVRASGYCMRPWASDGDTLIVKPLIGSAKPGMILLTRLDDQLYAHRAIETRAAGDVRTKGDSHPEPGVWFAPEAILGQVVAVQRGRMMLRLDSRAARLLARLTAAPLRAVRALRRSLV